MALLIAISLILSLVFSVTAVAVNDLDSVEKTEIISSSTQACGDSWEWTGTGDRIAALPYGEIYADEIFVAAICSPYWTSNHYTAEATQTTVTFTSGEGLVTIALRQRNESVIWGGADCVFAEITPTAAASQLSTEKTVSGTFQMFYAAWGTYCNVPFEITLKPGTAGNEETPTLPDPGPNPGVMRAAMAVVDITPARDVQLQGYDGASDASLAKHPENFTSDLKARILILDNGSDRLVFLNFEMVFSGSEYGVQNLSPSTLQQIAEICHTDTGNIMLSNTHNHQANMSLAQREEQHILQGVAEAYSRLAPVKIGTTTINTQFGISRGGDYTMDANAPYDNLMTVVRFDNAETGVPIGLIYSVPMHNTMLSNGPSLSGNWKYLNCEFTGYASREIETQMAQQNPNFTAMHINGFYGNAGPYANGKWYASSLQELQSNGAAFAEEILAGFRFIQTQIASTNIQSDFVIDAIPANQSDQSYRQQFGDRDEMPLYISLSAFGDIGYVGVNYEPYSIIGARLKAESPYSALITAGDVNGWNGYIPTEEAIALHNSGSYQVECDWFKTPFDAQAEEIFYNKVLDSVCNMAGVDAVRVSTSYAGVANKYVYAEYTFNLSEETPLDKLVISFGQNSRTDCAKSFDVIAYNASNEQVWTKTYTDNSVNYLGEFVDGASVAKVVLRVRSRYNSSGLTSLQPEVYGMRYCELPEYTEIVSDTTDYANYGGSNWEVEPMTVEATIGTREKFSVALATSYWANTSVSGYSATPTKLNTTFTNGEGLLDFYVNIAAGPIWDGAECEMLTIVPTNDAYALTEDVTVTGTIDIYWRGWVQMPFSVTIDVPTDTEDSEGSGEALPEYTETVSDTTDYANFGGSSWEVDPMTVETTIGPREKFSVALATSYWANTATSGYSAEPTKLNATFTNGEGSLDFYVTIAAGPIWGGAECEMLTIVPTDAAYALTADTTVTGTIEIYWRGWVQMPFSVTIDVPANVEGGEGGDTPEVPATKTEVISDSTAACGDDWTWTGDGDKIATLPSGEISVEEIYVAAVCSPYWTDNHYTTEATETTVTFTAGEGLVTISLRNRQEDVIWGGAECVFAEITPTAAGEAITEATTVSGTFQMFYASWGANCEVPFEIVLKPVGAEGGEGGEGDDTPEVPAAKTEVISESTDACADDWSWTGDGDKIASLPAGEVTVDQIYVAAVSSPYWSDNTYTTEATPVNVTFTSGEGLVTIALRLRNESVIWGGADCVFAEITPTAAGEAITEATTISGTFQMFYAPWGANCEVPFEIVLKPVGAEGGEGSEGDEGDDTPEVPAAKAEVISESTDACGDDWSWTGDDDKIASLPAGEITVDQIYVAAVSSPYWSDNTYTTEATPVNVTFTSGEGLVTIALRLRNESVIWGGADCVFAEITPTAAGEAITEATTISGTFQMFYAAWGSNCEVPFEIVLKPVGAADDEPEVKTEVISDSTAACGDDWSWTGDDDKIATLPYGKITADEIFVAAVCTPYWTDNHYTTEATETTVTFTSGDGLVTIALRNRQEDVIWGGAECVFAEITPTEAAKTLTEDTTVSGTFQMFYAPWGVTCEVPFSITIQVPKTECTHNNMENYYCADCGYYDEAALQSAMDLNADGKITVFDAQMLAESNAGLRQLSNDQLDALGTLTVSDIVDYVLGRYKMPTQT